MFQKYACIEGFFFLVLLLVDCDVHGHARGRSSNALNMARQVFSVTSWGHFRVYDTRPHIHQHVLCTACIRIPDIHQ